jgi:epoxyqueuosine reductase
MTISKAVQAWAKKKGYWFAAGGASLVAEVRAALEKRRDAGEIEAGFFRDNLDSFTYLEGCPIKNPQSVIIIAVPRPAHILSFSLGGKKIETILPPTYVRYRQIFEEVRDDLREALSGFDCCLELLNAPLKALGNRLGLLSYGRNNVGYINGLGSYFQLVGLVSDKRFDQESAAPGPAETLLSRCRDCRVCAAACPTGAIDRERILLHAGKCYTVFSESPKPIPESLKPPSPKCLIGCLRCQQVCPENKGLLRYESAAVSFNAEETEAFLGLSEKSDQALDQATAKFLKLGMTEGFPVFARNLARMLRLRGDAIPGKA